METFNGEPFTIYSKDAVEEIQARLHTLKRDRTRREDELNVARRHVRNAQDDITAIDNLISSYGYVLDAATSAA